MSVKSSPAAVSPWDTTTFQTALCSQMFVGDSTTNYDNVEDLNDNLVIEDLDLGDLEISSSSVRTSFPSTRTNNNDYGFEDQIPGVVSEACTKNNLYILVRVPTDSKKLVSTNSVSSQTSPKMSEESPNLCSNANRKIFPILEEVVATSIERPNQVKNSRQYKTACWTKDSEIREEFASTTNIIHQEPPCLLPNQVPETTSNKELFIKENHFSSPIRCQNQIELEELNLNSIPLKGSTNVSLENYGILITPTKMPKTENLLVFQVDTEAKRKRRSRSCSCFQWLRKLFGLKERKSSFVHAKVYKTYFVKWKKYSDDKECSCPKRVGAENLRRNSA